MPLYLGYYVIWRTNSKQLEKVRYSGKDLKHLLVTASASNYYLFVGEDKKQSENLKSCYSKKKNNLKRKSATGAGLADAEAVKRDLKEYGLLAWLEEHLQLRKTKTSITGFRLDDLESGSTDHLDFDDTESLDFEPDLDRGRKKMKTTRVCIKVSDDKVNPKSNNSKQIEAAQLAELFALQSIGNAFVAKAQSGSSNDKIPRIHLFPHLKKRA